MKKNLTKQAIDLTKKTVAAAADESTENNNRRKRIDEFYEGMHIANNNVAIAPDWHVPFQDRVMKKVLYKACEEHGVSIVLVPGDFFDCDNYTKYLRFSFLETFREEIKHAKKQLEELTEHFKHIYFCRGNHEERWLKENKGLVNIRNLFAMTEVTKGYSVTSDDFMKLKSGEQYWHVAHPKNFSSSQLAVTSKLASKLHANILGAHGHQLAEGYDVSGHYKILDGGGIFDPLQLEYLRNTTCYPSVHSGFYIIQDGEPIKYPGCNIHGEYR